MEKCLKHCVGLIKLDNGIFKLKKTNHVSLNLLWWSLCLQSGSKEGAEDKLKGPTQKAGILQKCRFSVTSDDADEVLLLKCSLFL